MAYKGLYRHGVAPKDAEYYLKIILNRVRGHNGSEWTVRNYRNLLKTHKPFEAMQILTATMYSKQEKGYPVSSWGTVHHSDQSFFSSKKIVKHIMSTDIFSVGKKDSVDLVLNMMKWKNIHHMPVIDNDKELIGLISWTDVEAYLGHAENKHNSVSRLMNTEIITIDQYASVEAAKELMDKHGIGSLPVLKNNKLIGLMTKNDF
jgi:CBS domain-containing protein